LLADRTAHSMIDYWHDNVVRPSVTLCIMAKRYIRDPMISQQKCMIK